MRNVDPVYVTVDGLPLLSANGPERKWRWKPLVAEVVFLSPSLPLFESEVVFVVFVLTGARVVMALVHVNFVLEGPIGLASRLLRRQMVYIGLCRAV